MLGLEQCSSTFFVTVHPLRCFDELMHPIYLNDETHAPCLLTLPPFPPPNCTYACKYPGLNKQVP